MPPDPPRGQGPPGLADWGPRGGDSKDNKQASLARIHQKQSQNFLGGMPPDPPRGQGPPGLADWGPRGGDSDIPDSPEGRGKSRNVTL